MTIVNTTTGEIVPVSPEERTAVARLSTAIAALTDAVDFMPIAEVASIKAQVATIQTATKELGMSKEAQELAAEAVRRAEWSLGRAIRKGQADGTVARQGYPLSRMADEGGHQAVIPETKVGDLVTKNEWRGDAGIAALAEVDGDTFDAALAEAKAEGNLSRANVARKAREKTSGPVAPAEAGTTERAHQEAELINAFGSIVRRSLTPKNVATLTPKARARLIQILNDALNTLKETSA